MVNSIKDFILYLKSNEHLIASLEAFCQLYEQFTDDPTIIVSLAGDGITPTSTSGRATTTNNSTAAHHHLIGSDDNYDESRSKSNDNSVCSKTVFNMASKCLKLIKQIPEEYNALMGNDPLAEQNIYLQVTSLFGKLIGLKEKVTTIATQKIAQSSDIIATINGLVEDLSPIVNIYTQLCTMNTQATFTENVDLAVELSPPFLELALRNAVDPEKHFLNYPFSPAQIEIIEKSIGKKLFEKLLKAYELSKNNFTLDDLRMMIIGVVVNCEQPWENNQFTTTLLTACDIQGDLKDVAVIDKLRSKIKLHEDFWKKISKEIKRPNYLQNALKYLNNSLRSWDFLIPTRFKANSAFKRDYKSCLAITNINDWDLTNNSQPQNLQQFASEEYVFNNLSAADFAEGSIIPALDKNGEKIFYKLKHIIDEKSIHGFALIPTDPTKSLDIKVVFKNSQNLSEAVLDLEHYLPYKEFKNNKNKVMQKLNQIVEEFKQEIPEGLQKESISLNIGGQGTGGTLASHLMHEIISQKANILTKKEIANDPIKQQAIANHIGDNVTKQFAYEVSIDPSLFDLNDPKSKIKYLAAIEKTKQYAQKHILEKKLELDENSALLSINQLHLSTINGGGVPRKIRNNFVQALRLLKDQQFNGSELHLTYNKIVNVHDIVKKRGMVDLGAYIKPDLMHMKVLQIVPEDPNYLKHILKIGFSSILLASKAALDTTMITVMPYISPLVTLTGNLIKPLSYNKITENIVNNAKELWEKINNIHYGNYLDLNKNQQDCHYILLDNTKIEDQNELMKELHSKGRNSSENSKLHKKMKKKSYRLFRKIQGYVEGFTTTNIGFWAKLQPLQSLSNVIVQNMTAQQSPPILPGFVALGSNSQLEKQNEEQVLATQASTLKIETNTNTKQ